MYHGHVVRLDRLGAHLKELRRGHKLTLQEVSDQVELSSVHISLIENGVNTPSISALTRLARCYRSEIIVSIE